jgi:hypothetical protein
LPIEGRLGFSYFKGEVVMRKLYFLVFFLTLALYVGVGQSRATESDLCNATLIEKDWKLTGDGLLTYDSDTNFEWIDMTVTRNMSVNYVSSQLSTGGLFEGFRYATNAEVTELFLSLGGHVGGYTSQNYVPVTIMQNCFGITHTSGDNFIRTGGFTGDAHPTLTYANYIFQFNSHPLDSLGEFRDFTINDRAIGTPTWGNFLLRSANPVPEPSVDAILAFFDKSVDAGTIYGRGRKPCLADHRLRSLREMLETAKCLLEADEMKAACNMLKSAFNHCDSEPKPKDSVEGDAVPEFADKILELMEENECELF